MRKDDYGLYQKSISRVSHNYQKMLDDIMALDLLAQISPPFFSMRDHMSKTKIEKILMDVFAQFPLANPHKGDVWDTACNRFALLLSVKHGIPEGIPREFNLGEHGPAIAEHLAVFSDQDIVFSALLDFYISLLGPAAKDPDSFQLFCNELLPTWGLSKGSVQCRIDYQYIAKVIILRQEEIQKMMEAPLEPWPHFFQNNRVLTANYSETIRQIKAQLWLRALFFLCERDALGTLARYDELHSSVQKESGRNVSSQEAFRRLFQ